VTERDDAKKMNPDAVLGVGWCSIYLDNDSPSAILINAFLRKIKSRSRVRLIVFEDAVRASGLWTLAQAGDVANRMVIGKDGEFVDSRSLRYILSNLFSKHVEE
jgi:hypothetical protein